MRKITHLLCLFLLALIPLSWAENTREDVRKTFNVTGSNLYKKGDERNPESTSLSGSSPKVWSQPKTRRLFARQKKPKSNLGTKVRRCGRLMETCSPHLPCCDPCAACRCRLFKTICYCRRMNSQCFKMT